MGVRCMMPILVYDDNGDVRADMIQTEEYNGLYVVKRDAMLALLSAYKAGYEQARSDAIAEETRYEEDGQSLEPLYHDWLNGEQVFD